MKTIRYTVCLSLLVFPIAQANAGSVQCECPSIDAKGTGNSDCSASESGGVCTIDFNTFGEAVEKKAFKLVSDILGNQKIFYTRMGNGTDYPEGLDPSAAKRLMDQNPHILVDLLAVYTMVSVVQNDSAEIDKSRLRQIFETLRKDASDVSKAFIGQPSNFRSQEVLVTPGCIEIRDGSNLWAMYKSRFSPVAKSPQCQK
jgi:hypothetical protein